MPSKYKHRSSSDNDSSSSDSYSSSSSDSEYHSKHRRKKKQSKHKKHKHKDRKRHRKSKHKKKSKSKSRHKHKHQSKKRYHTEDSDEPKHKKRKLNHTAHTSNPCTDDDLSQQQMINNAKTVLNMFCEDDNIKQYMKDIFTKLDNNQSINILNENTLYQQPLKMIFTFLCLTTIDDITYTKPKNTSSLVSLFKSELETISNISFIGPQTAPVAYKGKELAKTAQSIAIASDFVGVTMPSQDDLVNNRYSSEEDVYGPAFMNNDNKNDQKRLLQMKHSKIYVEMKKKMEGNDVDIDDDNEKREEWMTTMPKTFLSDFEKGTKNRGFNMNETDETADNVWTQAPSDVKRKKRERKRIKAIEQQTNEKLKYLGLPSVEEHMMNVNKMNDGEIEEIERVNKGGGDQRKSLFEEHQEKLMKEYKEELKEWKRKKKNKEKAGAKPVFKGVKKNDIDMNYSGSMDSYYNAQNPVLSRSKLSTFVSGGTIADY